MGYKTLLAVIQNKNDIERVLDHALPLASRLQGHVIGIHAEPMALPYTTAIGFPDAEFMQVTSEVAKERAAELEKVFAARTSSAAVSAEWRTMESLSGDSALCALASARAADLVIAAQTDPAESTAQTANVDHLLFETGRPALFVPYAGPVTTVFRKILVAWNGTRESSRATFDALPFIMEADETEILTIDAPDTGGDLPESSGADIAAALARHCAHVTVANESSEGIGVSAVIENRAIEINADLLVMGAYGHSRLREFLFGGVTREVLKSMPVATFMSR
ncbi:universal stress protein [Mesorhizobium sp. 1B3]|uniref:universal stress protein n=1 Tax=Mesorhizobium sp. 1B3 TaxID=3243599 RepID=UPI003D98BD88